MTVTDPNLTLFRRSGIVSYYAQLRQLQAAEKVIFYELGDQLSSMKVLDLGVGGGRTTQFLVHRVADYTGVDYSPEMIHACENRFLELGDRARFQVGDARDLSQFADHAFDFIFFSFNGIDNMSHQERLKFLQDVVRIGKPGGYFAFSTHNLQGISSSFSLLSGISINPYKSHTNGLLWACLRLFNRSLSPKKLKNLGHAVIRDESHNFQLPQYYIRPEAQLQQLSPLFKTTTVYSWKSGQEIPASKLDTQTEMWCYYLCQLH